MPEPNLCRHCFSVLEEGETVCSACGQKPEAPNPDVALPLGTVLSGQYRVGMVLHHNDLLTTYLAWDAEKDRKVRVEEFFPGILKRAEDHKGILLISAESKTLFRTMASDLHDRWKRLMEVNHKAMLKTLVLFSENDTLYRVTEYLRMEPLEEYLSRQKGEMSLTDARQLISPLISLLSQLHNMGLTHCGISPQNIYVDSRKRVILDGFALPELRTVGNGLHAELYAGYSAPEQYSKALWQGEWTDIYSLGAVLYRMLAGQAPVSAELRGERDDYLAPLGKLRPDLPEHVCEGIMKALSVDHKQRYRSMEAFSAALLEEAGANTAVFRPEAPPRPTEKPAAAGPKQFSPPMVLLAVLLAVSVIGNVLLALWNSGAFDGKEQPATPVMERSLEGYYLPAIEDELEQMSGYNFIYRYEYSDTYPSGVIYKQSLAVGQVLPEDGSVTLYISKGPQYTVMPDLYGANEARHPHPYRLPDQLYHRLRYQPGNGWGAGHGGGYQHRAGQRCPAQDRRRGGYRHGDHQGRFGGAILRLNRRINQSPRERRSPAG